MDSIGATNIIFSDPFPEILFTSVTLLFLGEYQSLDVVLWVEDTHTSDGLVLARSD